jgi:hypothetical protein
MKLKNLEEVETQDPLVDHLELPLKDLLLTCVKHFFNLRIWTPKTSM